MSKILDEVWVAYGKSKSEKPDIEFGYYALSTTRYGARLKFEENYSFAVITEIVRYKKDDNQLA